MMTIEVDSAGVARPTQETIKERRERFYARLERNEDKQIKGRLCKVTPEGEKGFCCLGVATEQAIDDGLVITAVTAMTDDHSDATGTKVVEYGSYGEASELPREVMEWYGFRNMTPDLPISHELGEKYDMPFWEDEYGNRTLDEDEIAAISANDDHSMSFPDIASCFREADERGYL